MVGGQFCHNTDSRPDAMKGRGGWQCHLFRNRLLHHRRLVFFQLKRGKYVKVAGKNVCTRTLTNRAVFYVYIYQIFTQLILLSTVKLFHVNFLQYFDMLAAAFQTCVLVS